MSSNKGSLTDPLKESSRSNFLAVAISLWLFALMKDLEEAIVILHHHQTKREKQRRDYTATSYIQISKAFDSRKV